MFTFLSGVIMLGLHGHSGGFGANGYTLNIYIGALLGILMFLNVWLVIWPAQKVVIASSESVANGGEAHPEAAYCLSSAGLASRTNTLFSIPMLFFMAAARGLALPISSDPVTASISTAIIAASVIILLLQANGLYGKTGPMTSVMGVIHCGLVLTIVLYLCVTYLVV